MFKLSSSYQRINEVDDHRVSNESERTRMDYQDVESESNEQEQRMNIDTSRARDDEKDAKRRISYVIILATAFVIFLFTLHEPQSSSSSLPLQESILTGKDDNNNIPEKKIG